MMAMSAMNGADAADAPWQIGLALIMRVGAAAVVLFVVMRYALPWLVHRMAKSQELLLIFAVAWGTALASLGEWVGFSKEAGAFLAGFSLASTAYREAMSARLTSLRDFLLLFFFVELGSRLDFSTLQGEIGAALILSLFVLIGNPLIVMAIMGYMGYRRRTGFLAGLTVAQISEFSIIFVAMGIGLGHVGEQTLGLTTLVGLITITLSTYLILYSHQLYERLARWLTPFERRDPFREVAMEQISRVAEQPQVVVFGLGRYGARLMGQLKIAGIRVLGVDFDPDIVHALRAREFSVRFGDAEDRDFVETLPLAQAQWVVCILPQPQSNRALLDALAPYGFQGEIAAVVREEAQATILKGMRFTWLLNPFNDAADFAARRLAESINKTTPEEEPK